jgi:hypothetical protein
MSMMDHIRRSMKGEPSPPKLNEIKSLGEKPIAIAPRSISSIDAKIKALIESKKQVNEIMEAPLGKETTGAPVPSTDNFSVKGKGKPKVVNGNGNAPPAEVDGQEQVELGGVTPVDLAPETKDVTQKDLRKESFLGGLKAGAKFIGKRAGAAVANELGKQVGIKGSTITGTISALASGGGKKTITAKKNAFKAGTSTTKLTKSAKPNDDNKTPPTNPMSADKAKSSKKPAAVKGATAGSGEPEKMTPDQFRKEVGLPARSKAKPGTAPESSTSKGATLMSKDSLFKQGTSSSDTEKPAHQPAKHTIGASPGSYSQKSDNPMSVKSSMSAKSSGSGSNRLTQKLNSRLMSSSAASAKTSNPMSAKSSGVSSLDKFKNANRMKIRKINEELLELVKLVEWQNRFKQLPAMGDVSAEDHLNKMVHHHNKGLEAKAAGDKTRAIVHFNTRDHHFAWYFKKAPEADSNRLDLPKIRAMLDVKEDITPLDKVMEIRRRIAA